MTEICEALVSGDGRSRVHVMEVSPRSTMIVVLCRSDVLISLHPLGNGEEAFSKIFLG